MKKWIGWLFRPLTSNKYTKSFFWFLYRVSLIGLFGDEWDFHRSGEGRFLHLLGKLNKRKWIVFDVGANEGGYTKEVLAALDGKEVLLYGFEPAAGTFSRYQEMYRDEPRVKCAKIGLGDKEGEMRLFHHVSSTGLSSLYHSSKFGEIGSETVMISTVDKFCEEQEIPYISLLKMDVEGHEFGVLQGALRTMKQKRIEFIQFEFGACNVGSRTFFRDFYDLLTEQYRLFRLQKNGMTEILKYDERLEIFGRVMNYVAIHRSSDYFDLKTQDA